MFILLFILFGCNSEQPMWKTDNWTWTVIDLDTMNILDIQVNDMPIITNLDSLVYHFGKPDTIWEKAGAFFTEENHAKKRKSREDWTYYKAYLYKGLKFAVWDNQVRLNQIDFINNNGLKLVSSSFELSNKTDEEDIYQLFPNSYKFRKCGLTRMYEVNNFNQQDIDNDRITWLYIYTGVGKHNWYIELALVDKRLAFAFFDNIE